MYTKLTEKEESLAREIVDIAVKIHIELGPGLLESVYEKCFSYELNRRNIFHERQKAVPIIFNG